jgi:hypothetical protein
MKSVRKWLRFLQLLGLAIFMLPMLIYSYAVDWDQEYEEF